MSVSVTTLKKRVQFVDKVIGDVGDGTAWPMLVTLDQLAEIMYRVKDAKFVAGYVDMSTGDPYSEPTFSARLQASTTAPTERASYSAELRRGYTTPVEISPATISAHNQNYLLSAYDAGSGAMYRDIGDNERGIWLEGEYETVLPYWDRETPFFEVTNAFSFDCGSTGVSVPDPDGFSVYTFFDLDPPTYSNGASAVVVFSGEVAVVRTNPENSFYASTNLYYLGLDFTVLDGLGVFGSVKISTNIANLDTSSSAICNYVMRLAPLTVGGSRIEISCPIYCEASTMDGFDFFAGTDFIHEAFEWFPYAKDSPATAVWNSGTGVKL